MIRWLEELITAIQTGSGGVDVRKKTQVYLLLHLTLCLSDPPRGRFRSPSCPFWSFLGVITKGYVQRVSPAKRALVSKQKKNNLCYVTHWCCCCCCLWQWSCRRKPEGGEESMPGENDLDRELKGRVKKKGKRWCWMIRCCPRAAPSRFLYFVYFHLALHSLLHRGHQLTAAWHHWLLPPSH